MNRTSITLLIASIVFPAVFAASASAALPQPASGTAAVQAAGAEAAVVSPVDHVQVCMVTNRVLGRPQLAVEFEGKTYYGCCPVCVGRIQHDRRVRYSVDPLTGAEVDKARAFIVEGPGGAALYFESADTAAEFARLHEASSH